MPNSPDPPAPGVQLDSDLDVAQDNTRKVTFNSRSSDTDTKAAPTAGSSTEQTLKVLKCKVMTIYKNYKFTSQPNHQPRDVSMLKELSRDPDAIVKRSDKCKGLVVLPKVNTFARLRRSQTVMRPFLKIQPPTRKLKPND